MKDPFAPGQGYFSLLDNVEETHDGYWIVSSHEKIPAAGFYPVLEMVQEVYDGYLFDPSNGEIRYILRSRTNTNFDQCFSLGNVMLECVQHGMMARV